MRLRLLAAGVVLGLAACACSNVSVSDGSPTSAVTSLAPGTATLSWSPVTQTVSGAPLEDLAGYMVFYGPSPSSLDSTVVLPEPDTTSYQFTNLPSGTWYFTVAAYTTSGVQGVQSNVGQKTIP